MNTKPGTRIRIIEDCRTGHHATGQIGVYEGQKPRSVSMLFRGQWYEYIYSRFVSGEVKFNTGEPIVDIVPRMEDVSRPDSSTSTFAEYETWCKTSGVSFWDVDYNPLIRLPDGSTIWGDECWWEEFVIQDHTLGEAQASLEHQKEFLRAVFAPSAQEPNQ